MFFIFTFHVVFRLYRHKLNLENFLTKQFVLQTLKLVDASTITVADRDSELERAYAHIQSNVYRYSGISGFEILGK